MGGWVKKFVVMFPISVAKWVWTSPLNHVRQLQSSFLVILGDFLNSHVNHCILHFQPKGHQEPRNNFNVTILMLDSNHGGVRIIASQESPQIESLTISIWITAINIWPNTRESRHCLMCKTNAIHNRLYVLLSFPYVLFSFGYALFSFGYALFSFDYALFSFKLCALFICFCVLFIPLCDYFIRLCAFFVWLCALFIWLCALSIIRSFYAFFYAVFVFSTALRCRSVLKKHRKKALVPSW